MYKKLHRGGWLTAFLILATIEAAVGLEFLITMPADAFGSEIESWKFLAWQTSAAIALIAVLSIWFWSRLGVLTYSFSVVVGPIMQAIRHSSINWVPVVAIGILCILVRPNWKYMPWGVVLKSSTDARA